MTATTTTEMAAIERVALKRRLRAELRSAENILGDEDSPYRVGVYLSVRELRYLIAAATSYPHCDSCMEGIDAD